MNTEQKIAVVKKSMNQKICFGLKVEGSEICKVCPLAAECATMRIARLTYELQQFDVTGARPEADADFEAKMESMSKAKFEAMIDKALSRRAELETMIVKALSREAERKAQVSNATAPGEQQSTEEVKVKVKGWQKTAEENSAQRVVEIVKAKVKGRPRSAKEKSDQVLTLAARGVTRQAIANELGISLASVYRILKESS